MKGIQSISGRRLFTAGSGLVSGLCGLVAFVVVVAHGATLGAQVVINEIDYDQAGTDMSEFIELANVGGAAVDLASYSIELVNGNGGGASVYLIVDLPAVELAAGGYFVVCADTNTVEACDLDIDPDSNLVQNGGPDAVALLLDGTIVDTVSYEGDTAAPYTEGSGDGLEDQSNVDFAGISRFPDGVDTDQNNIDLSLRCISPGAANVEASESCDVPETGSVVVNEVEYDQPGTDTAEFVELFNGSTVAVELSTLRVELVDGTNGGAVVYRSIPLPAGTLDPNEYYVICGDLDAVANCQIEAPDNINFLQDGAPDAVALLENGVLLDTVSYEGDTGAPYTEGSGAGLEDDGSAELVGLSRFPNGADTDLNNADFSLRCTTPGQPNSSVSGDCDGGDVLPISAVQGNGLFTPFDGQTVTTEGNVVTAVAADGFYIQTPDGLVDGDPETSEGIFVFTTGAPSVSVGDEVRVVGEVTEFFDLTEITNNPLVTVTGTGLALPLPVTFDAETPSPDQPQPDTEVERYEGMLVTFSGVASGPSDRFGDVPVVATAERPFREPGIEFPGLPDLPVWDGNPEVFELNPDAAGLPDEDVFAGQTVTATGALTFSFGDYAVAPTELEIGPGPMAPTPVRPRAAGEFTIGSLNMFRVFDTEDDPDTFDDVFTQQEFDDLMLKFSSYVREVMDSPDILAVQEAENLVVLDGLAARIALDDPSVQYTSHLLSGNDVGGINVGFLTRTDRITVNSVEQFGLDTIFEFDGSLLNDRPPLILDAVYIGGGNPIPITVIDVHQRSLSGIDDPSGGERVRTKRFEQAFDLSEFVQDLQTTAPDTRFVVLGDFNAFQFTDGYVDVIGQISGNLDPLGDEFPTEDLVNPDLQNAVLSLPPEERYSFIFDGSAQVLDHVLLSATVGPVFRSMEFARGNADAPSALRDDTSNAFRASDHDGLVLYLGLPSQSVELGIAGSCPGPITLTVSGGTPGGQAAILFSDETGDLPLPGGPCAGADGGLVNPKVLTILSLDGSGDGSISATAPANVCGTALQVVDAGSCELSPVSSI